MIADSTLLKTAVLAAMLALATLLLPRVAVSDGQADFVLVVKSERKLYLLRDDEVIATFPVTFGSNPEGHKRREGDGRTPEGHYLLDWKHSDSDFYKSIHISYPNDEDKNKALDLGSNPGGAIMIHGQKNGYGWLSPLARYINWTDGCIALKNSDMDKVWESVNSGTPIEIRP